MDTLPLEVLYIISLYLDKNTLSLNTYFSQIYNKYWYKDYLLLNHPNTNVNDEEHSKLLYNKLLQTGDIHVIHDNIYNKILPIKGIACNRCGFFDKELVLTFDNKLYLCDHDDYHLIDTNVINIDNSCYITHNKCYVLIDYYTNQPPTFELIDIQPNSPFIKHKKLYGYLYLLTNNLLYIVSLNKYPSVREINTISFNDAIDIGIISSGISILQSNGDLYYIDISSKTKILCSTNINKINNNVVDNKYIINKYKNTFKTHKLPNKCHNSLLLDDNLLVILNNKSLNTYKITIPRTFDLIKIDTYDQDNVKNIFSDGLYLYIIK